MQKKYKIYLILSILISAAMITSALLYRSKTIGSSNAPLPVFTTKDLAIYNGKNNSPCYVAIDGRVYSIKQGNLWKEGEHTTSNGQAYCGLDLSDTIGKSPHGKSKLTALPIVGNFEK